MEFIDSSHAEWSNMWTELSEYPLNNGDSHCMFLGASWQYMGSSEDHHHFRHSMHPKSEKTEYIYIERRRVSLRWA
ncbi:MAG: hypothetical protein ACI93R_000826 [Flavobacteriales bacterium]|jgi:hypothetical protein